MVKDAIRMLNVLLIFLLAVLLTLPAALAALSDYTGPLKGLEGEFSEVLSVYQDDLKDERIDQLSSIALDGKRLADRTKPQTGVGDFAADIQQKIDDYEDAIVVYSMVVGWTKNELNKDDMKTLHDHSQEAILELTEKIRELKEYMRDDDESCFGTSPDCKPDGVYECWLVLDCDYDDEDFVADIDTDDIDDMRAEARGTKKSTTEKIGDWVSDNPYWTGAIILIILLLILAIAKKPTMTGNMFGWLYKGGFRLGRAMLMGLLAGLAWMLKKFFKLMTGSVVKRKAGESKKVLKKEGKKPMTLDEFREKNKEGQLSDFRAVKQRKTYDRFMRHYKSSISRLATAVNGYLNKKYGSTRPPAGLFEMKDEDYPKIVDLKLKFKELREAETKDKTPLGEEKAYKILKKMAGDKLFPLLPDDIESRLKDLDGDILSDDDVRRAAHNARDDIEKLFKEFGLDFDEATSTVEPSKLSWWGIYRGLNTIEKWFEKLNKKAKQYIAWTVKKTSSKAAAEDEEDKSEEEKGKRPEEITKPAGGEAS